MNEFAESTLEWLREKVNAPIYAIFSISVITWNGAFFYTLFIEDKIPPGVTRLEFSILLINKIALSTGYTLLDIPLTILLNFLAFFAVPTFLTYMAIRWLPIIHGLAHKQSLKFYFERKLEYENQKSRFEETRTKALQSLKSTVSRQRKVTEEIVEEKAQQKKAELKLSEEDRWEIEYQEMKKNNYEQFARLTHLQSYANKNRSLMESESQVIYFFYLINLYSKDAAGKISLTDKGKYFLRRFATTEKG